MTLLIALAFYFHLHHDMFMVRKTIPLSDLTTAVTLCEGANKPRSICYRRNNPGCLKHGGKIAKFKTRAEGLAAMEHTLLYYINQGLTLNQTIERYAPKSDGNKPSQHAKCIAAAAFTNANIPLKELIR